MTPAPAADVDTDAEPAAAAPLADGAPKLSRREREQQEINDRIRTAVDRATADLRAELSRVKPAEPAAPVQKEAEHKRYLAMPEAPKLADFDSIEEHSAAMAVFVAKQMYAEQDTARTRQTREQEQQTTREGRLKAFDGRLAAAKAADPTFYDKTQSVAAQLVPSAAVLAHKLGPLGPLNSLADEVIESEHAPAILAHLAEHPEVFARFKALTSPRDVTREFVRLEASFTVPAKDTPPAPPKKILSDLAPPPPALLTPQSSTDPKAAALARGDFGTFDKLDTQERQAKRQGLAR